MLHHFFTASQVVIEMLGLLSSECSTAFIWDFELFPLTKNT